MSKCFQFVLFLLFSSLFFTLCPALQHYSCPRDQSLFLLKFKQTFTINEFSSYSCSQTDYPKTLSWNNSRDCCTWEGVTWDKITRHVVELDLSCSQLEGTIGFDNSLFELSHLRRLNLAYNDIQSSQISKIFGSFTYLTHLNLSSNGFEGQVPYEILNLTELISLDLSDNVFTLEQDIFHLLLTNFTKLRQVSLAYTDIVSSIPNNLSASLEDVDLSESNLKGEVPETIFHLPNLHKLILGSNPHLYGVLPSSRWNSSTTLEWLHLYDTSFKGEIPDSIGKLKALKILDLSTCGLNGSLPEEMFTNMTQIETIDLSHNKLIGSLPSFPREMKNLTILILANNSFSGSIIPSGLFSLSSLEWVDLSFNQFYGHLPIELSSLVNVQLLDLSSNNLSGRVEVNIFSNMKQVDTLSISHNKLSLVTINNSLLPKSIQILRLASCNITELDFLRSMTRLTTIDLSMNNIREVPSWIWSKLSNIRTLNISYNFITHIQEIHFQRIITLDIRSNLIQGTFPQLPPSIQVLLISNNQFFGMLPASLICRLSSIEMFDLSNNNFTGSIPHCVGNMSESFKVLDMRMNMFEGTIPNNFSSSNLVTVNLYGNHLRGNIPASLAKCMNLKVLDLGNNFLNDSFPSWLGVLPELRVLSLRSNNFHGKISLLATTSFTKLQMLDLSQNQFIGNLSPMLFESFTGMMDINETSKPTTYIGGSDYYKDSTIVVYKGIQVELVRILTTWTTIDLSSNNFEGKMPSSIGSLISLRLLNFSSNRFAGEISISFENLSVLESLDLSSNQLTGTIPTQLTTLNFLSKFNLSLNHLTGRIPTGTQFQNFDNDSYIGNDGLCGTPMSRICRGDKVHSLDPSQFSEQEDSDFIDGFGWKPVLIGYGVGIVSGLWIGFVMFLIGKPLCLMRFVEKEGYRLVMKRQRKIRISKRIVRRN